MNWNELIINQRKVVWECEINKIVDYLKPYKGQLEMLYPWDTPSEQQVKMLENMVSEEQSKSLWCLQTMPYIK